MVFEIISRAVLIKGKMFIKFTSKRKTGTSVYTYAPKFSKNVKNTDFTRKCWRQKIPQKKRQLNQYKPRTKFHLKPEKAVLDQLFWGLSRTCSKGHLDLKIPGIPSPGGGIKQGLPREFLTQSDPALTPLLGAQ